MIGNFNLAALPPLLRYAIFAGAFLIALVLARVILRLVRHVISLVFTLALAAGLMYLFLRFVR